MLPGAVKDPQLITSEWRKLQDLIDGVTLREIQHVPDDRGVLTEVFRAEWSSAEPVAQVIQVRLFPGVISAWHCHLKTTDRLFAAQGLMKLVLHDAREGSGTRGRTNVLHIGECRPGLITIPPEVWHGVQNVGNTDGLYLNCPTEAYNHQDPDHYRLPKDTKEIPYSWS